jgi:hypothetical protein
MIFQNGRLKVVGLGGTLCGGSTSLGALAAVEQAEAETVRAVV